MTRYLEMLVKIKDAATAPMKRIAKQFQVFSARVRAAGRGFKEFNRVMFTATAFVSMFGQAFSQAMGAMEAGAELDRLSNQFERVFGTPRGKLFQEISKFTDNFIPRVEAMQAAVAMGTLGMTKNLSQTAELIAAAGTAAKMAGLRAGEGINRFTKFLKDGSVTHLAFLNLIENTNPALQTELSVLKATTGILGGMISTQRKLMIGRKLLLLATIGQTKGNVDLLDTVQDLQQALSWLGKIVGGVLATSLNDSTKRFSVFLYNLSDTIEYITKMDSSIVKFIKSLALSSIAVGALTLVVGGLYLAFLALGGVMSVLVLGGIVALTAAFYDMENPVEKLVGWLDKFLDNMKKAALMSKAVKTLVKSFYSDEKNIMAGTGQIPKKMADELRKMGLLDEVLYKAGQEVIGTERARRARVRPDYSEIQNLKDNWMSFWSPFGFFRDEQQKQLKSGRPHGVPEPGPANWPQGYSDATQRRLMDIYGNMPLGPTLVPAGSTPTPKTTDELTPPKEISDSGDTLSQVLSSIEQKLVMDVDPNRKIYEQENNSSLKRIAEYTRALSGKSSGTEQMMDES